jgi:diguanylate cyclase (GGDEF)-like protein
VPLTDRQGEVIGVIWADDPADRLLPGRDLLQALRVFANQATTALDSATHFEEMRFLADHDPLTRLLNRRAFTRRLAIETARSGRYHRPFALVTCDLDGFKTLNDRHGHLAGDAALERMGALLRDALRTTDAAFRIGGDEFAMLLPETDEAEVRAVIDRVATGLTDTSDPQFENLGASFGVAVYPRDGGDPELLFRAADDAMYTAKRSGERMHFAA